MSNRKGIYPDRIVITGDIQSYQGNEVGRRHWLKKLNENKSKVVVQLVSQNPEMKETLERLIDFETVSIEFPWRDIPEKPKCNGDFDREAGEIVHGYEGINTCPVHRDEEQRDLDLRIKGLETRETERIA
jgi:hypothetical protein